MQLPSKTIIAVVGPTATGKTSLSIELAKHFNTEIISSDSRQFYKEMTIGTAVPGTKELNTIPHHFIQNRSIFDDYSVGDFEKEVLKTLDTLFNKHDTVIMVGGSGLYIDAVLKGLNEFPKINPSIRKNIVDRLHEEGLKSLQNQLKELDPKTYQIIALDNPQRVTRALEVCLGSGLPYSYFKSKPKKERAFRSLTIGLNGTREKLYHQINQRTDKMIECGLIEEAQSLYKYRQLNALQTVGYREFFSYFDGTITEKFAIQEIKKNTRRFAKRQLTWFRKDLNIHWIDFQLETSKMMETLIQKHNAETVAK